ncbi:unnamed protein product [Lymnaea stagnalis]|uniref:PRELI/MSF1 domain-containing protein n=1 Tax=Lymnaea stagnalis TaxID=6523 RepID=A0AAV2H1R5_LYMST
MVVSVDIIHVFKYPIHLVVNTHFMKYPTEKEKFVLKVETIERHIDWTKGIDYRRRLAFCQNVIPRIMRKFSFLNEKEFLLEEEAWLNLHNNSLKIKSRNITWANYAQMCEESKFVPSEDNPNWTKFEQHGQVSIINFGPFSQVLEIFAGKFLLKGAHKALSIMEELLYEKSTSRDT